MKDTEIFKLKDTEIYKRWKSVYRAMITWDAIVKYQTGKPISEITTARNIITLANLKYMEFALSDILNYPSTDGIEIDEETYKHEIRWIEGEINDYSHGR